MAVRPAIWATSCLKFIKKIHLHKKNSIIFGLEERHYLHNGSIESIKRLELQWFSLLIFRESIDTLFAVIPELGHFTFFIVLLLFQLFFLLWNENKSKKNDETSSKRTKYKWRKVDINRVSNFWFVLFAFRRFLVVFPLNSISIQVNPCWLLPWNVQIFAK